MCHWLLADRLVADGSGCDRLLLPLLRSELLRLGLLLLLLLVTLRLYCLMQHRLQCIQLLPLQQGLRAVRTQAVQRGAYHDIEQAIGTCSPECWHQLTGRTIVANGKSMQYRRQAGS
jgi:hypothetical protein